MYAIALRHARRPAARAAFAAGIPARFHGGNEGMGRIVRHVFLKMDLIVFKKFSN